MTVAEGRAIVVPGKRREPNLFYAGTNLDERVTDAPVAFEGGAEPTWPRFGGGRARLRFEVTGAKLYVFAFGG